jgi:hypothetical protein
MRAEGLLRLILVNPVCLSLLLSAFICGSILIFLAALACLAVRYGFVFLCGFAPLRLIMQQLVYEFRQQ